MIEFNPFGAYVQIAQFLSANLISFLYRLAVNHCVCSDLPPFHSPVAHSTDLFSGEGILGFV